MHRFCVGFAVLAVACLMSGCAAYRAPVMPPSAFVFSDIKAPLSTELNESTAVGTSQGAASASSVLGMFAWGDASVNTAAKQGGLSTVNYADYEYLSVLFGVYTRFTTVAHGN